jgi:hypothetical protein
LVEDQYSKHKKKIEAHKLAMVKLIECKKRGRRPKAPVPLAKLNIKPIPAAFFKELFTNMSYKNLVRILTSIVSDADEFGLKEASIFVYTCTCMLYIYMHTYI